MISVGKISGGIRHNIIADEVEMTGTIRTLDPVMQKDVLDRIRRTVHNIAESAGAQSEVMIDEGIPVVMNNMELTRMMLPPLYASAGELPLPSNGMVTCATCHLPRESDGDAVLVNHNNTYNLLPRDRMVKDVCINCHGLEFAYSSIFDDELVTENFARSPTLELETFDLIRALEEKRKSKK